MSRRGRVLTAGYVVVVAVVALAGGAAGAPWWLWAVTLLTLPVGVGLYLPLVAAAVLADRLPGDWAGAGTTAALVLVVAATAWANVLLLQEVAREARRCYTERAARRRLRPAAG